MPKLGDRIVIAVEKTAKTLIPDFVKFPSTPHLLSFGSVSRDDKCLSSEEADLFFREIVYVEEKVDGANVGISVDRSDRLLLQNRGDYLREPLPAQFRPLPSWLNAREETLRRVLGTRFILFGEWCYAKHTVAYTRLPDLFIAFDVYDRKDGRFVSVERRQDFIRECGVFEVPTLHAAHIDQRDIEGLMASRSRFGDSPCEGLYFRICDRFHTLYRAKVVRPGFLLPGETHWRSRRIERNLVAIPGET